MEKGDIYPAERSSFSDSETGVIVHRLTSQLCHSNHLYFTHWCYYDGLRRMVFHSDRGGARNLFGLDLDSGEIRQLTGFQPGEEGVHPFCACVTHARDEAYFWYAGALHALDLTTLEERHLWNLPGRMHGGMPNCDCGGAYVYFALTPDLSDEIAFGPAHGQAAFEQYRAAHPRSRICRVPTSGGEAEILWEEDCWIGHINSSPVEPNLLTFCHEGPWPLVDQRIWGLDAERKSVWRIRPESEGIVIGHEYWFADGSRVGYHGRTRDRVPLWGHADPLGGDFAEFPVLRPSMHFHSLGADLLVSDGSAADPYLRLWRWNGERYDGAVLCRHSGSFHSQRVHVHPAMTPDGRGVVFTSDMQEYGSIYFAEIPDFESLPPVKPE